MVYSAASGKPRQPCFGESSNGRTPDSGSGSWGSNPCSPAPERICAGSIAAHAGRLRREFPMSPPVATTVANNAEDDPTPVIVEARRAGRAPAGSDGRSFAIGPSWPAPAGDAGTGAADFAAPSCSARMRLRAARDDAGRSAAARRRDDMPAAKPSAGSARPPACGEEPVGCGQCRGRERASCS